MVQFAGHAGLRLNGYRLTASRPEATQTILLLAAGELIEEVLASWIRGQMARLEGKLILSRCLAALTFGFVKSIMRCITGAQECCSHDRQNHQRSPA